VVVEAPRRNAEVPTAAAGPPVTESWWVASGTPPRAASFGTRSAVPLREVRSRRGSSSSCASWPAWPLRLAPRPRTAPGVPWEPDGWRGAPRSRARSAPHGRDDGPGGRNEPRPGGVPARPHEYADGRAALRREARSGRRGRVAEALDARHAAARVRHTEASRPRGREHPSWSGLSPERTTGFEPATPTLARWCSTA